MPFEVNPDGLRAAAGTLALLPAVIDNAPHLDAESHVVQLEGLSIGAELAKSDSLSLQAKNVLKSRFNEFSALLILCADTFHGTDQDAAKRLAAVADLNSGDPHGGN
ncbi:hypothetical protein [Nocardia vermiculata]|uniref:Excreted virulence factor EspC (Type VII ESX diderm) n=1 Tax=Nocardia vermiculata TaxID=257274 RepID=A0A846Y9M4_9NOCA|nr:hypothetical protein [Nocardia vermiculata]NKY54532.1 hypothetical protein [Nocardia vermiculata]